MNKQKLFEHFAVEAMKEIDKVYPKDLFPPPTSEEYKEWHKKLDNNHIVGRIDTEGARRGVRSAISGVFQTELGMRYREAWELIEKLDPANPVKVPRRKNAS